MGLLRDALDACPGRVINGIIPVQQRGEQSRCSNSMWGDPRALLALSLLLAASATPSAGAASALQSAAGIDWLEIESVTDAFGGDAFGPSGPYVYIAAVAHGKLDPRDPANSRIVDLDKAPRTNGLVDYQVDVGILRPKDAAVAGNLGQTRFNMPARC